MKRGRKALSAVLAAALLLSQRGQAAGEVRLRVSGAAAPVRLRLQAAGAGAYLAGITMLPSSKTLLSIVV